MNIICMIDTIKIENELYGIKSSEYKERIKLNFI